MKFLTFAGLVALGASAIHVIGAPAVAASSATAAGSVPMVSASDAPWTSPTAPPRCTEAQIRAGETTGCVIQARGSRGDAGFGYPPSAQAPGMRFNGWSYAGAPAQAWEREFITANTGAVAGVGPGKLLTHVVAAPLFEGFLAEIAAGGYVVRDVTGYTFRCTSGSGGNCTDGSMSAHAWGLAIDLNAGANPNRSYYRTGDVAACDQPVVTDFPKWVIDAAQRWGLYWGGYGWSDGCRSSGSTSEVIRRDTHHFEFNGTVADALTIARNNGATSRPMFCFALVSPQGTDGMGCNLTGVPSGRWRTPVPVSPPAGSAAAIVNVTVTGTGDTGYVTVEPCTRASSDGRATSNNNYTPRRATANLAFVPVNARTERICVWRATPAHTVVDIVGYVADTRNGAARLFQPRTAERLWDTRVSGPATRPDDHGIVAYPLGDDAIVNVTVTGATEPGYATASRCEDVEGATATSTSTVNYLAGEARANVTFAMASNGRGCVYAHRAAHVIVDVAGTLVDSSARGTAYGITPITARRLLDTRAACGAPGCPRLAAGSVHRIPNALGSGLGVVNVTVTSPSTAGFVTVGDCSSLLPGVMPGTSTVNHTANATVANLAFVASSTPDLCVWVSSDTHVVVDLQAEMSRSATLGIQVAERRRAADTRLG